MRWPPHPLRKKEEIIKFRLNQGWRLISTATWSSVGWEWIQHWNPSSGKEEAKLKAKLNLALKFWPFANALVNLTVRQPYKIKLTIIVIPSCIAPCRLGASPECVCVAREARRDQEDDAVGSWGHQTAGRRSGDGGHWKTEGQSWEHAAYVRKGSEHRYLNLFADWLSLCTQLPSGDEIPLPPIVLGRLGSDPGKKTVCIYGHLDVQPANIDDGWDTEPFTLVEKDGERQTVSVLPLHKTGLVWLGMFFTIESDIESAWERQTRRDERVCASFVSQSVFYTSQTLFHISSHLVFVASFKVILHAVSC